MPGWGTKSGRVGGSGWCRGKDREVGHEGGVEFFRRRARTALAPGPGIVALARQAEDGGADSLWVCDHFFYRPGDGRETG